MNSERAVCEDSEFGMVLHSEHRRSMVAIGTVFQRALHLASLMVSGLGCDGWEELYSNCSLFSGGPTE
jgi:hypothetical protein